MAGTFKALSKTKKILLGLGGFILLTGAIGAANPQPPSDNTANLKPQTQNQNKSQDTPKVKGAETKKPIVETKTITETTSVPFQTTTQNDAALPSGQTSVVPGTNGEKTITYRVTYTDGAETGRQQISELVTKQPVNQITKVGTKVAAAPQPVSCSGGYINVDGNCVPSPSANPAGATAQCNDGTYSYSQHRSGTCSHHGGVARWL